MTKIALLSDIHGNTTALEAVLADTRQLGVVAEAVQRKLNPQEEVELVQVAEERVDCQTEGNHHEL